MPERLVGVITGRLSISTGESSTCRFGGSEMRRLWQCAESSGSAQPGQSHSATRSCRTTGLLTTALDGHVADIADELAAHLNADLSRR